MKHTFAIAFLIIVLAGCSVDHPATSARLNPRKIDPETSKIRDEIPTSDRSGYAIQALEDYDASFAFNYLKQLAQERPGQNVTCAPLSLTQDLSLLRECTKGPIHDAVNKLMGIARVKSSDLARHHAGRLNLIESDPYSTLRLSSAIWLQEAYKPDPAARKKLEAYFGCSVKPFSSDLEKAKRDINEWVSQKTDGLIPGIQSSLKRSSTVLWLNALAFNGSWETPFEPDQTKPRLFHCPGGDIQVPTMFAEKINRRAAKVGPYTVLTLPFSGNKYQMTIVMPDDQAAFQSMLVEMNPKWLKELTGHAQEEENEVSLPKLDLSSAIDLKKALSAMGAPRLFGYGLDLSPLVPVGTPEPDETYISEAYQQVKLSLTETGVKAAALTESQAECGAREIVTEHLKVHIDRPFVYFVRLFSTIVLCGVVVDPTKN